MRKHRFYKAPERFDFFRTLPYLLLTIFLCLDSNKILTGLSNLLNKDGRIILLDSTPKIYLNEWLSFSTADFPENKNARSGDKVKIIIKDISDKRPIEDIVWFEEDYLDLFSSCHLQLVETLKPLATIEELYNWVNETKIAPWVIYVLKKALKYNTKNSKPNYFT